MKLLFFFPGNPLDFSQGNNVRANSLLHYFKDQNIDVDFVTEKDDNFTVNHVNDLKNNGLVSQIHWLPKHKKGGINYLLKVSIPKLFSTIPKPLDRRKLNQQQIFNHILKNNTYDFVLISYACWIPLILNKKFLKGAKTIVDTHDFLTSQFKTRKDFNLGKFFKAEMDLLNHVDYVWSISVEEQYVFEQFINKPVFLVPHITQAKSVSTEKTIDLLYVASDNQHNIKAVHWFFNHVFPLLKDIKLTIVGKINNHIDDYPNVEKLNYVQDLSTVYSQAKVVICPMLSGTGLKIKVIEALSFGLPIVCNTRGVDGLINKTNNGCLVTDNAQQFANNIMLLLEDKGFYNKVSSQANQFYTAYLSKEAIYGKLDLILK